MIRIACTFMLLLPVLAQAFCSEPDFNEPIPPTKPDKPFCVSMGNCTEFDVDMYKREMEYYLSNLKYYVNEAQDAGNQYAEEALEYAKCELSDD